MEVMKDERGVTSVTIRRPSNLHAHLRQDEMMRAVTKHVLRHTLHTLVMPNTGPILTMDDALLYHSRLRQIVDEENLTHVGQLLMTLYLTSELTPNVIEDIAKSDIVRAVKYYPFETSVKGTTGSGLGPPLHEAHELLRAMEVNDVPLLGHFETVIDKDGRTIPPALREDYMVEHTLPWLRDTYPKLRICFEHISTKRGVQWVKSEDPVLTVATVTPQHSLFIADDFGEHGTNLQCMPIVKTPEDRAAVLEFITSGDQHAIAGDDTAPHPSETKHRPLGEASHGCWLPHAIALYTMAFERAKALDGRFELFMSVNGPRWWNLPMPTDTITIRRTDNGIPEPVPVPELKDVIEPLGYGVPGFLVPYEVQ